MSELLRITAMIHGPVAFHRAEGLALDGPLLYHATKRRLGEAFYAARPTNAVLARATSQPDHTLGLAVYEAGGTWLYCVSQAEIHGDHGTELSHWNKRFDAALAGEVLDRGGLRVAGKVNTDSGPYKSYHQPLFCEVVERLVWYAQGEAARLRELLGDVLALGKKRHSGAGRVLAWDVTPVDGPVERWLWRAPGVLARPVPLAMLPDWAGARQYQAYRPPYWLPAHQAVCAISVEEE